MAHILITGGAGYIGSMVTAHLLASGQKVTVLDSLLHGGDAMLGFSAFPGFRLVVGDVRDSDAVTRACEGVDAVIHLAALVGYPVCNKVGRETTFDVNLEGTKTVYQVACQAGAGRFLFASSYSNYGIAETSVSEESPLNPQSSYAESKVAAEEFLLAQADGPAVTCLRLATLFGVSPRTRFDLMVNQFALTAHLGQKLVIYQKDFNRAFLHVADVARLLLQLLEEDLDTVAGEVFNVGGEDLNSSKGELITLIRKQWPDLVSEERELSFEADMRSVHVCFDKIRHRLGFMPQWTLDMGIAELHTVLSERLVAFPDSPRHRNHEAIVT